MNIHYKVACSHVPAYFGRIVTTNDVYMLKSVAPLSIHYVAVPPPIPVAAGFEDTFAFFNGQLYSGDLPIFVILRSNNDDIKRANNDEIKIGSDGCTQSGCEKLCSRNH